MPTVPPISVAVVIRRPAGLTAVFFGTKWRFWSELPLAYPTETVLG